MLAMTTMAALAKLERGSLGEQDASTNLCDVVAQVKEATQPQAEAAQIAVTTALPREGVLVRGDAISLATVVSNLVANAITYNRPGGRVAVCVAADDRMATLEVRDTGIGIPEDACYGFEEFYQVGREAARRSRHRARPGLRRRIVTELGGRSRSRTLGQGSTFTVRIPMARRRASDAHE
jgi:signal transduction histidine kinase